MTERDQAYQLRQRVKGTQMGELARWKARPKVALGRTIAVTSGKGGVGKSNFTLNFAIQLQKAGYQTVVFDADLGLANMDILMGVNPRHSLKDLLHANAAVTDVLEPGPHGLYFLPGSSGLDELVELDEEQRNQLLDRLKELQELADFIIIDTGAGLTKESVSLLLAADDVILITTPEPTSLTDGYAVIKYLFSQQDHLSLWVVINRAANRIEAERTGNKVRRVARRFLEKEIRILGYLPENRDVIHSVKEQVPFSERFPNSPATERLYLLTRRYLSHLTGEQVREEKNFIKFLQKLFWRSG